MKNIPISYITWIVIFTSIIALPNIFEFGAPKDKYEKTTIIPLLAPTSNDSETNNPRQPYVAPHNAELKMVLKQPYQLMTIQNDTLTLYNNVAETTTNDIIISGWWLCLYIPYMGIFTLLFLFILFDDSTDNKSQLFIPISSKRLPTKEGFFYYDVEESGIRFYECDLFVFKEYKYNEYPKNKRDTKTVIEILNTVASEIDSKNMSFAKEELKNWKRL